MIYRFVASSIVAFWAVMTALLIRNEITPDTSKLRELPVSHVLKLLFLHGQHSDLRIYTGNTPIGHLRVSPHVNQETEERVLEMAGNLQLSLHAQQRSRVSWDGTLVMNSALEVKTSNWGVTLSDPGYLRAEVRTKADSKSAHLTLSGREGVLQSQEIIVDDGGLTSVAQQMGASAELVAMAQQAKGQSQPVIRARQSSFRYRGERTETYLITVEQNDQILLECHISQLGTILQAKTILGHTLQPDDLLP